MLSVFTTLTLISCNYILENNKYEREMVSDIENILISLGASPDTIVFEK